MLQTGELKLDMPNGAANADLMQTLMIIACVSFPIQLISLMIMRYKPRLSIAVAIISSIALMPITIVFTMGMIFSAIRWRYHQLTPFDTTINVDFETRVPFNKRNNRIVVTVLGLCSIVLIILSQSMGMFLFVLTIFLGFFGKKAGESTYLAIKDQQLYIRPNIFAFCYRVPLKDVTYIKAEKGKLFFEIKTENNILSVSVTPLSINAEDQENLELLINKIKAQ